MSRNLIHSALILTITTFISKVLGSFFRIPLQNIAGNEVLGIYTLVYPVYMAILILSVAGIPLSISKLISESVKKRNEIHIDYILKTGQILSLIFGVIGFFLMISTSHVIADLLGGQFTRPSLIIVSTSLLIAPYMAVYRGYFQGFGDMRPTAVSQVLEQFVRVGFILLVASFLVQKGFFSSIIAGSVMGGSIIGVGVSLVYLLSVYGRTGKKTDNGSPYSFNLFIEWSQKVLRLSIPLCIGSLSIALIYFVDSLTVPTQLLLLGHLSEEIGDLYGFYGRGVALVQIIVVFVQSLILPLIPAITSALVEGNIQKTTELINKAVYFTHLTTWPISIGFLVLTIPLNYALFGDFQENLVIAITHLSGLFTAFAVLTTGILQGINRPVYSAIIIIGCAALKIILNILFIQKYGLLGVPISTLFVYIIVTFLNLWLIRVAIPIKIWIRSYTVFGVSSLIMGLIISFPYSWIDINGWSRLEAFCYIVFMIILGAVIYGILVILFKTKGRISTWKL